MGALQRPVAVLAFSQRTVAWVESARKVASERESRHISNGLFISISSYIPFTFSDDLNDDDIFSDDFNDDDIFSDDFNDDGIYIYS
jgi:hypothetical protein